MEYEEKLHTAFSKSALIIYNYLPEKLSLFERIARLHAEYLPRAGTYLWDIEHIYRAVQITMNTVFIKYQRGRYNESSYNNRLVCSCYQRCSYFCFESWKRTQKKGHEVKILTLARGPHSYILENVYYVGSFSAGAVYPDARIKIPLHSHLIISRLIKWNPDIIHSQCEFSTFLAAKKSQRLLISQLFIPIIPFMRITRIIFLRIKMGQKSRIKIL